MTKSEIFNKVNSATLISDFVKFSTKELGEIKIREINDKVNKSKRVAEFLKETRRLNKPMGTNDFLGCTHSIISFTFAKAEIISIASVLILERWNTSINIPNQIASNEYLREIFFRIIDKCNAYKINQNDSQNFFNRFYKYLEDGLDNIIEDNNDPTYWVILALKAITFYEYGFDFNNPVMNDSSYNAFILNCSLIYWIKFPNELDQYGWDHAFPEKNLFNELVLKLALSFFDRKSESTGNPLKETFFEDIDEMESCLKNFAIAINKYTITYNMRYLRIITHNFNSGPITKEFEFIETSNDFQLHDLTNKFKEAMEYIANKLD